MELPSLSVAVYAHVTDCDFFREVTDEAGDVDEIVGIGDEEGVGGGHVGEVVLDGRGGCGAEETGELCGAWLVVGEGGGKMGVGWVVKHGLSVLPGVEMGSVRVRCGVCLSRRGVGAGSAKRREGGVPARVASGICLGGDVVCALVEFLSEDRGGDGGQGGESALDVVPVVIGAVVCACGSGERGGIDRSGMMTHAGPPRRKRRSRKRDR